MLLKFTVFRGLLVFREGIPKKMKQSNFYIFSGHNPQKITPPHGLRTFGNFTLSKKNLSAINKLAKQLQLNFLQSILSPIRLKKSMLQFS